MRTVCKIRYGASGKPLLSVSEVLYADNGRYNELKEAVEDVLHRRPSDTDMVVAMAVVYYHAKLAGVQRPGRVKQVKECYDRCYAYWNIAVNKGWTSRDVEEFLKSKESTIIKIVRSNVFLPYKFAMYLRELAYYKRRRGNGE